MTGTYRDIANQEFVEVVQRDNGHWYIVHTDPERFTEHVSKAELERLIAADLLRPEEGA